MALLVVVVLHLMLHLLAQGLAMLAMAALNGEHPRLGGRTAVLSLDVTVGRMARVAVMLHFRGRRSRLSGLVIGFRTCIHCVATDKCHHNDQHKHVLRFHSLQFCELSFG